MKLILKPMDFYLFRNMLNIFYDTYMDYNNYIKGKFEFVETFDEDKYQYKKMIVENKFYNSNDDLIPIEDFERSDIVSKYDLIQQFIFKQNITA